MNDATNDATETIAQPPTPREKSVDRAFKAGTAAFALTTVATCVLLVGLLVKQAWPAITTLGLDFITGEKWDPGKQKYGVLPEIFGTVVSSAIGVALATLFGVAVAVFLTERFVPRWLESFLKSVITLLAAIPSVVYGLWGIFVLIPAIRPACNWVHEHLGWIPLFKTPLLSVGLLPASLVLAIMILPTVAAIARDAIAAVDPLLREAAFGMGATRWETIFGVTLPASKRGIYGAVVLGLGRALGETMALAMLIGSTSVISPSLFSPADTLAALLANKFPESASPLDLGALMYAALILLSLTLIVNVIGELIISYRRADSAGVARKGAVVK